MTDLTCEDALRAARLMQAAADQMTRAAADISDAVRQQQAAMSDFTANLSTVLQEDFTKRGQLVQLEYAQAQALKGDKG